MPCGRHITSIVFALSGLFSLLVAARPAGAASGYAYTCFCLGEKSVGRAGCGLRGPKSMTVTVTAQTAITRASGYNRTYRYDASYQPRGSAAAYLRFNGGTSNYDGFGRSASQNNSLFLFSWMAF